MKLVYQHEIDEMVAFKERAKAKFLENRKLISYTDKHLEEGCFFAIRWGVANQAILVFKISEFHEPIIFGDELPGERDGE